MPLNWRQGDRQSEEPGKVQKFEKGQGKGMEVMKSSEKVREMHKSDKIALFDLHFLHQRSLSL